MRAMSGGMAVRDAAAGSALAPRHGRRRHNRSGGGRSGVALRAAVVLAVGLIAACLSASQAALSFAGLAAGAAADGRRVARSIRRSTAAPKVATQPIEETDEYRAFAKRHMVDEKEEMAQHTFPVSPETLITWTKRFLATEAPEATMGGDGSMLTDDFQFVGPVIGPLNKEEFMAVRDSVQFFEVFPDATAQFHHFRVDPFEPNRVWWTARGTGTHTGYAEEDSDSALLFGPPTNIRYRNAPQACSVVWTADGLAELFTIGYVMDRTIGNTGGMGGFFGVLYAIGKQLPFDEGKAWAPSLGYQFYVWIGRLFGRSRMQGEKDPKKLRKMEAALIKMPGGTAEITK